MSAQAREGGRGPSLLEQAGLLLATPFVETSQAVARAAARVKEEVFSYLGARRQNAELQSEVAELRRQLFLVRPGAAEADELRALLRTRSFLPGALLAAPIVSVERRGSYRRALLAAGGEDGVSPGSPLAVPEGLIGRVLSVSPRLSKAILVTDADCAVGARIVRTGDQGVVRGEGDALRMDYLSSLAPVVAGDVVETAGIDGLFPRGIPLGRVAEVWRGKSIFLKIRILPSAPLSKLGDVLVLSPSPAGDAHP
jgi:rod shape-determining protein MreC